MQRFTARRLIVAMLVPSAVMAASCRQYSEDTIAPRPQYVELIVRNDGFLDANIYAVLSDETRGSRLGTVTGHSTMRLNVRMSDLRPGNVLVLRVHGIGAEGDWLSQPVIVDPPDYAELNLVTDGSGVYRFSNLYPRVRRTAAVPVQSVR